MFRTRKSQRKKVDTKIQASKKADMPQPPKNKFLSNTPRQEEIQVLAKKASIKSLITTNLDEKIELDLGLLLKKS
jgi:hypothetical protein